MRRGDARGPLEVEARPGGAASPQFNRSVRSWTARATPEGADAYVAFFRGTLVPQLSALPGHRGALVLTRDDAGTVHITVLTFWDSMDAVRGFAGADSDRAVVEEEARGLLLLR